MSTPPWSFSTDGCNNFSEGPEPNPLLASTSFCKWAICLPRMIARSRTRFAWHLHRSFTATWRTSSSSTTTFPLPVPHPGCFSGGGPRLSKRRLAALAQKRLLHITVFCLNYLYLGRFPSLDEIGRRPNAWQLRCFARLRSLLVVSGSDSSEFPLVPGRSGPDLAAAIWQLEHFVSNNQELRQSYAQTKPVQFEEDPELCPVSEHPELQPYKSLDAGRLKLVGEGAWPIEEYISGVLWMPFQEPRFLLHGQCTQGAQVPAFHLESKEENLRLAKIWDAKGLLRLFRGPLQDGHSCRVFNAHKSNVVDRQIGDRRVPNAREFSVDGPSRHLPPGFLLTNLRVKPLQQRLRGSITDRRDFYHQAKVSEARANSNLLPFQYQADELTGCVALARAIEQEQAAKRRGSANRQLHGDGFGVEAIETHDHGNRWYVGFGSLFQGDHLGVEFALQAHETLLVDGGSLDEKHRLRGHALFPLAQRWEGLIIDDYFAIGAEEVGQDPEESFAHHALLHARSTYEKSDLPGSPEKDVVAACCFKAAGAEIVSSEDAVKRGVTLVAAPLAKRIALSSLSLRAASLPVCSAKVLSRLAGNWTSVLMYRRCMMAIVDNLFAEAASAERYGVNCAVPMTKTVAEELALLSALAPIAASNVAVDYVEEIFASDASLGRGAVVSTKIDENLAEVLWLGSDKKGCYTRLDGVGLATLAAAGEEIHDLPTADPINHPECPDEHPYKSPLLYFDFVEFFGGAARVSKCLAELGFTVAPPLDLSMSSHYDMTDLRVIEWCMHMIASKRFRAFLTEPPCTTFSPAAHPAVRSYKQPEGFDRLNPKTLTGNILAFRSFALLKVGYRHRRPCGKEQPRLSKMAWLRFWSTLIALGFEESVIASCQFGSPHRKEFRFLTYLLDSSKLETRCPGGHQHIRIQGAYTKQSAVYTWELSRHLAEAFAAALRRDAALDRDAPSVDGYESIVINDLLIANEWIQEKCWCWKKKSHINVLESHGGLAVLDIVARRYSNVRFNALLDSRVAKGALAKGRSTSAGLQRACKRSAALQLSAGLYPGWGFAPTRLNVADDPTRGQKVRAPSSAPLIKFFGAQEIQKLHAPGLVRWAANWARLVILVHLASSLPCTEAGIAHGPDVFSDFGFYPPSLPQVTSFTSCLPHEFPGLSLLCTGHPASFGFLLLGFCLTVLTLALAGLWTHKGGRFLGHAPLRFWILVAGGFSLAHANEPTSALERSRAQARAGNCPLPTRVVRKQTLDYRSGLLKNFAIWLFDQHGLLLSQMLTAKPPDAEEIANWLVEYGKAMFSAGKAYGKYAETINAISTARPIIRKQLVAAWDFAYAWLADEPFQHHPAMPLAVLLAMMTTAVVWGWPLEAAIIGLTWAGILRIGEVFLALRQDLILPRDSAPGVVFGMLRIRSPKTRGRAARHQAARIDAPDLLAFLDAVFGDMRHDVKLWPFSAATLRKRFGDLLRAVGLPTERKGSLKPFDLGSLRPGGATHLLIQCENSEIVRRRGRWVTTKVMEVYLQEVMYTTYTERLDGPTKAKIAMLAGSFSKTIEEAIKLLQAAIPPTAWFSLFQANDPRELGRHGSNG